MIVFFCGGGGGLVVGGGALLVGCGSACGYLGGFSTGDEVMLTSHPELAHCAPPPEGHPYRSLGGKRSGGSGESPIMTQGIFEVKNFPKIFYSMWVRMVLQSQPPKEYFV